MSIDGVPFITNIKTNDNGLQSYEYADGSKHTRTYDNFKGEDKPYYINHYKWYIEIPAQASSNGNMGYWYAQITD